MEDKQCKQTEQFPVIATGSNYFLLLDDKKYKVKINNTQGYDSSQIKKRKNLQVILVISTSAVKYLSILNYFLFSLSPLTKEELKAYKSLESYNQFI